MTALPSTHEAFGLVLVESLACGTPVVALADGGPGDIVTEQVGATAVANAESLAQACLTALRMARSSDIATRCRAEARKYDWDEAIVPRLEQLYRKSCA